ncbi:uncharacterized protein P884DRAFT_91957 [Thermothelomyces heterothallicus CBS 202.75]|uniref:uncharacterized protein n=1 Tax=Thermothelomyces heterothallicus CBS 202.75 TaxID=1149848 RepID=UPI0037442842
MDFINKFADQTGGNQGDKAQGQQATSQHQTQQSGSGSGGFLDKLQGMAGGGAQGEKREDALDNGIDWVQENILKQGPQNNESATEQAKDRFIAQQIRDQYRTATGKDFPIKEKEKNEAEKKSDGLSGLF